MSQRNAGGAAVRAGAPRRPAHLLAVASAILGGVWSSACSDGPTGTPPENATDLAAPWTRAEPQEVGLDPNLLYVAGELAGRIDRVRTLVVVRDGRLAYERYYGGWSADTPADMRSVTKSVVSMLVGIAVAEGQIESVDAPITDFIDTGHAVRPEHALVTIRHLLTMTGGFSWGESEPDAYNDWVRSEDHVDYLLARPLVAAPGTTFAYNSAAVHLLGVILEEATGTSLPAYADLVLFGPLGIAPAVWEELNDGYNGSSGLALRPRDAARLGQLALQQGWSGKRPVVPAPWIERAVSDGPSVAGRVGPVGSLAYGYLWWRDPERGAFFAWGFGGQFIYVDPPLDLVVVAATEWRGVDDDIGHARLQEEVMRMIVDYVLPSAY